MKWLRKLWRKLKLLFKKKEPIPDFKLIIEISEHAKQRLSERLKCKEQKYMKVVKKALRSRDVVPPRYKKRIHLYGYVRYKYFLGFLFIFQDTYNAKTNTKKTVLITVYNPKYEKIHKRDNQKILQCMQLPDRKPC